MQVTVPLKLQNSYQSTIKESVHHQKSALHLTLPPSYFWTIVIFNRPAYRSNTFQKLKREVVSTKDNGGEGAWGGIQLDQQITFQTDLPASLVNLCFS